jgi:hypothetical protein
MQWQVDHLVRLIDDLLDVRRINVLGASASRVAACADYDSVSRRECDSDTSFNRASRSTRLIGLGR